MAATHRRRRASVRTAEQAAAADGLLRGSDGSPHTGDAPSDRLEREERCRQVRYAISQLADEYRVVLVLREMEGYCYETIAEVLDLPVGTVRSRLHRARMQLREQLREVLAVEE